MRIEGAYELGGSIQLVWSLLHDPAALCAAFADCEEFDELGPNRYVAALQIHHGPLQGRYVGQIQLTDEIVYERFSLILEGVGPDGSMSGRGVVSLEQEDDAIVVHYRGNFELSGLPAEKSPRLVRTLVNSIIRQFFANVARLIQIQTRIHTTQLVDERGTQQRKGGGSLQNAAARMRRERRTIGIVLGFLTLIFFTLTGVAMFLLLLLRLGKRTLDRTIEQPAHDTSQAAAPPTSH